MFKFSKAWLFSIFLLSGCPGQGDRLTPSETTKAKLISNDVCFNVPESEDFQPSIIIIAPRKTPHKERWYRENPPLEVRNGSLCIPPTFYSFTPDTPYIVEYLLTSLSKSNSGASRHVVVGFELTSGRVHQLVLDKSEISQ